MGRLTDSLSGRTDAATQPLHLSGRFYFIDYVDCRVVVLKEYIYLFAHRRDAEPFLLRSVLSLRPENFHIT